MGRWEPVEHLENDNGEGLYVDEIAVTIGFELTAMATFAWPEEGKYAVCRLVDTGSAGAQPLDAPDSAGFWIFEGYINYANGANPNMIEREVVRVFWGKTTNAWHTVGESGRRPASMLVGKWWKLTMPWDDAKEDV